MRLGLITAWLLLGTACGGDDSSPTPSAAGGTDSGQGSAGVGGSSSSTGGNLGSGGKSTSASAGKSGGGETSGSDSGSGGSGSGGRATAGGGGVLANGGQTGERPPAEGTPGVWEDVTSDVMDREMFSGDGFGAGNIVVDPARPTDLYLGGYGPIYKSTDYGLTWTRLNTDPEIPEVPLGHVLAVAGTTPATIWVAHWEGGGQTFRSRDGGKKFQIVGELPERPGAGNLYSIKVDPSNANHLISGLHEEEGLVESNDGGDSWHFVTGDGFPKGVDPGVSWFPFFVDVGDAEKTSKTWFAIAQDGGSAIMTEDGGETWVKPKGIEGLMHPHGGSQLLQVGNTLFIAGMEGPAGIGVYRSTDLGKNWKVVAEGSGAIVWGSTKNVYAMWGWACGGCTDGAQYQTAPMPGDKWSDGTVPSGLNWGPNSVAITSDGTHAIYVGSMWQTGIWRYVEP